MKAKPLYRVIQYHPASYRPLVFERHEVFATKWHWLARLYAQCLGGVVESSEIYIRWLTMN